MVKIIYLPNTCIFLRYFIRYSINYIRYLLVPKILQVQKFNCMVNFIKGADKSNTIRSAEQLKFNKLVSLAIRITC